jgi:ABC-2 type transport system permease protein
MKLHTIALIEIKKSIKGVLKVSLFMALFVILISSIFDPELFAGMEEMLEAYPEFILEMIGGALDLSTYGGFYTMEFLSMIWIWLGIYFILQAGQDIPSTIEDQTIDLILSKPLKRWEFVLGRYMRFLFSIFLVMLFIGILTFLMIAFAPNLQDQEINFAEFFWGLTWAFVFLVSLASTAFFFSVFLTRKQATGIAFGILVLFFVIGTFYSFFDEGIQDIKYLSVFFYYDPSRIIISHDYTNVVRDFLILIGYSVVLINASILLFNKRDIPV